jgi:Na+-translocating ferredoxin:NAD+ oxidoreductase RnfD subunit
MLNFKSVKTQLIIFLTCFAIFLSFKERSPVFLYATCAAVISALMAESLILYFRTKIFQATESSIITGLIVGFVLSSDEAWWKLILAAVLAIVSKYLIQIRKKHIFNPAAFGILLAILIFGASTQWNGTYLWYILLPFGLYFSYKLRKIEILISYAVVSLALFGIQAAFHRIPFAHIFGYFSYFYIFIMVIEPKTTPVKQAGKIIFGALVSGLIFVLTAIGARFDVELFSLLALNMAVPLLNRIPNIERG